MICSITSQHFGFQNNVYNYVIAMIQRYDSKIYSYIELTDYENKQ